MIRVICENNHYFDKESFSKCPHCGAPERVSVPVEPAGEEKPAEKKSPFSTNKTFGIFGRNRKKIEQDILEQSKQETKPQFQSEPVNPVKGNNLDSIIEHSSATDSKFINKSKQEFDMPGRIPPVGPGNESCVNPDPVPTPAPTPEPAPAPVPAPAPAPVDNTRNESLLSEVKKVSVDNSGKTVGFFNAGKVAEEIDYSLIEPVVGWLICLQGPHFGKSFELYAGRNSIGRNDTNKVCLNRDATVSGEKHAWIIYEPINKEFFVQCGDSSGLIYINGKVVLQSAPVYAGDTMKIGNSILKLISLCGDDFSWEDYQ